ncbi:hypothetical protein TNIN_212981 [Trichonephila inaurata madagascariensis]|uniref:Uncharacterized protein n=1 Tax=Trichonephila inaurata madagascariensis TaxID=2747483 RepID=A0A8X6YWB0_9ARAC|nr:hypothetical protein TNIN_212981 [Trichonephila inaurata madagascariensis]
MLSTSEYNLRQKKGSKVESQPANEKWIQQGDQFDPEETEKQHYSHYAEEQRRSSSKNTRSRRGQHCQEKTGGATSQKSHSLVVIVVQSVEKIAEHRDPFKK